MEKLDTDIINDESKRLKIQSEHTDHKFIERSYNFSISELRKLIKLKVSKVKRFLQIQKSIKTVIQKLGVTQLKNKDFEYIFRKTTNCFIKVARGIDLKIILKEESNRILLK